MSLSDATPEVTGSGNAFLNFPSVDAAIQQMEGYFPGSLSYQNNNPGNIVAGPWALQHGASGTGAGGFANFPDYTTGQNAQDALVSQYANNGATLDSLISSPSGQSGWNPLNASGNNAANVASYQAFMSNTLGVPGSTPLSSLGNATSVSTPTTSSPSLLNTILGPGIGGLRTVQESLSGIAQSGFTWGRVATFLIGLIALCAGLYFLKPVNKFINETAGKVSKAASTGASIAA